jgi:hypothetical protein
MSEIPPDISISAAQSTFQAREASKEREAQKAGDSHAAHTQARATSEVSDVVETADDDVAVFADAEGTGSQGRGEDADETSDEPADTPRPSGVTRDETGRWHVDLEA